MAPGSRIVVVGSHAPGLFVRVKRVPLAGETVIGWDFQEPDDGGKGSNQALAAARLGAAVSFVGCVGRDRIGDHGEQMMRDAGVDTRYLFRSETTSSGVGFIILDDMGVPAMVSTLGANGDLSTALVDEALGALPDARVLLTQFEIPVEVALYAARRGRETGLMVIVNPAPAPETQVDGLDAASILVPNETEARILLGLDPGKDADPADMARTLRVQTGAQSVIITVGEKGAVGIDPSGQWQVIPPAVDVVDTSGAGDAFCAALAVGLGQGESLQAAAEWACAVAALSTSKAGTIPAYPTLDEVERFARARS